MAKNPEVVSRYNKSKKGVITRIYGNQKARYEKDGTLPPTYSKEWFASWLVKNPEFHRLYDMWVLSKYDKWSCPSVDRIDDNVGYTEYNIQLMTWRENHDKNVKDMLLGKNNKKSCKAVKQFNKNGDYLASYHSASEAARKTSATVSNINRVVKGIRKTAGGYRWKLK